MSNQTDPVKPLADEIFQRVKQSKKEKAQEENLEYQKEEDKTKQKAENLSKSTESEANHESSLDSNNTIPEIEIWTFRFPGSSWIPFKRSQPVYKIVSDFFNWGSMSDVYESDRAPDELYMDTFTVKIGFGTPDSLKELNRLHKKIRLHSMHSVPDTYAESIFTSVLKTYISAAEVEPGIKIVCLVPENSWFSGGQN